MADQDSSASPPAVPQEVLQLAAGTLSPEALALLSGPVGQAVAKAANYAGRALSDNTRRAYASDWKAFSTWCRAGGVSALPAAPVVIAGHRPASRRRWAATASSAASPPSPTCTGSPAIPGNRGTQPSAPRCAASSPPTPSLCGRRRR
ncbi:hypothetical protein [Teichococcus aestuarii]|uniref:hypothetical protein n=1 Tax=Teichococcus aestuarii TaxID=568898 RepID=UPI003614C930